MDSPLNSRLKKKRFSENLNSYTFILFINFKIYISKLKNFIPKIFIYIYINLIEF